MAHADETRAALRRAYISERQTLETAAVMAKIPLATARNWKRAAKEAGEDWDKLRELAMLTGGDMETMFRRILAAAMTQAEASLKAVEADPEMGAETRVKLMASLADSLHKMGASMTRFAPEADAMAIRLDTIKRLGEFIRARHPRHAPAFAEVLEPFAAELTHG